MQKQVADYWYGVEQRDGGIIRIRELHIDPYSSGDIWMVPGSKRDLIFDTGTGIVSLEAFVSSISGKPKVAVASCYYYDHAGGLYAFDERACHHLEAELIRDVPVPETFDAITDAEFSALPYPDFKAADYRQRGCEATVVLHDGDVIDLGDRKLEVLHIPGRTPGSIALFDRDNGYLLGGETAFIDPERREFPPEDNDMYLRSLARLAKLPVKKVFGGHYGSFLPERLQELAATEAGRYS